MPLRTLRVSRCPGRPAHDAAFDKALDSRQPLAGLGCNLQQLLEAPRAAALLGLLESSLLRCSACSNRSTLRCSARCCSVRSNRSAMLFSSRSKRPLIHSTVASCPLPRVTPKDRDDFGVMACTV